MNIQPKDGPNINALPTATPSAHQKAQEARERAISKLITPQAQEMPVQNPTQVSPEELSAVRPPQNNSSDNATKAPEATEPKPASQDPLSSQYAVLARKEKAIRAKVQELKAKEESFKAQEAAQKAKEAEYQSKFVPKDRLAQNPMEVLTELGISYDQLTSMLLNAPKPEDVAQRVELQKIQADLRSLRQDQEDSQKAYQEQQQDQYNQALKQISNEATLLVQNDPNFETIKENRSVREVVRLIERTFHEDGILLSVEEAAQAVEDHLVEKAVRISQLKKIQARLKPAPQKQVQQTQTQSQSQPAKTLTNAQGASRPMTAKERAIAAFKGQLK